MTKQIHILNSLYQSIKWNKKDFTKGRETSESGPLPSCLRFTRLATGKSEAYMAMPSPLPIHRDTCTEEEQNTLLFQVVDVLVEWSQTLPDQFECHRTLFLLLLAYIHTPKVCGVAPTNLYFPMLSLNTAECCKLPPLPGREYKFSTVSA